MFKKALPVFAKGCEHEMNYQLIVREVVSSLESCVLYITASSFYKLWVNGKFVFFGPSRAAERYARVDEIKLEKYDNKLGKNEIIIEIAGYNCQSLATIKQPSFVIAELRREDDVIICTGRNFEGFKDSRRVQKVERFSVQRHFNEVWNFTEKELCSVELTVVDTVLTYLPTNARPNFEAVSAIKCTSSGEFFYDESLPFKKNRYSWQNVNLEWGRFEEDEIEHFPFRWIQRQRCECRTIDCEFPIRLRSGEYAIVDMGRIYAGFIEMTARAAKDSNFVIGFSELCDGDKFEFTNINCQNVIECFLNGTSKPEFMSFEPYSYRFAIVMVKSGEINLEYFGVRTYEYDTAYVIPRDISDPVLKRIYDAGVRSFAHNTVDIYMDCPSRERAGWLCDSFFTSRVEYFLTGDCAVENDFLENYRLYKNKGKLPLGALPECYPSDYEEIFIPQWNLWYILEVYEYLTVRNTKVDKELFKDSVYGILNYLSNFENQDGLLEKLESWNFVEWSTANEWVWDVNYPTNFLYSEALERTGKLYGDADMVAKAERIRVTAREKSFNGEVFIDNAVRGEGGVLVNTENFSEAGQYYAILFGKADIYSSEYSKLREHVMSEFSAFSPDMKNFVSVNCMPGFYLKIMVLMDLGLTELLEKSIKSFFGIMIDLTDTLWEYKPAQRKGSYDHGFASYALIAAEMIDRSKKKPLI